MFHHHLLFLPFFLLFHLVGFVVLFFAVAILAKAFRRRRAAACYENGGSENTAFNDYRRATLRKLELEAEEFRKYLDGLRRSADAAAFEAFLKSRRAESGPAA